jgi:hypothetical protein
VRRPRITPGSISAITLETDAEALTHAGNRAPRTAITAQAGATLRRLEAMVVLKDWGDAHAGRGARLAARLADGTVLSETVTAVAGDAATPMGRDEIVAKFQRVAAATLGARTEAVAATLLGGDGAARLDPFSGG